MDFSGIKQQQQQQDALTMDLKSVLNSCKPRTQYTKISDLHEECPYTIAQFQRVHTPYGESIMTVLEGQAGEDLYVRVYLPKRYNEMLSDDMINSYNAGYAGRTGTVIHLLKKRSRDGSTVSPLEFV